MLNFVLCSGNVGAIRLLLLQNKLELDKKNIFGLTPLMKAAIQGHVRGAKTLLFAGMISILYSTTRYYKYSENRAQYNGNTNFPIILSSRF